MPSTIEEIEAQIRNASAPGFRFRLLARGQARAMIWREGALPAGAPEFSPMLSYDLLSLGYGLLGQGLRLRELGGSDDAARLAFEQAASALEAVIARGDTASLDREFHFVLAGAAYQLAHLSARAYSLLTAIRKAENFSPTEKALVALMLRDFEELQKHVLSICVAAEGSDGSLVKFFDASMEGVDADHIDADSEHSFLIEGLDHGLTDNFMSAMALFLFAMEQGDADHIATAIDKLKEGLAVAAELNLLPQWWSHKVAIHIIKELWGASFHERLPKHPLGGEAGEWTRLREAFIALLYRRRKSEIDLWPSQTEAAARAANQSDNLVVSLPTSAGKTRIAELCILRCLAAGKRAIFVTPLRALSAQTEVSLERTFAPLGMEVSSLYGSIGVSGVDADVLRSSNIVVSTPEKLDFAIRNDPTLLDDVGLLVFDEGHMIGLNEREVRYEAQIQRLLRRDDAATRRIVCLSAILPDGAELEDFAGWLTGDQPDGVVKSNWRPTRLRFGEVVWGNNSARLNLRVGEERPFVPNFLTGAIPPIGRRRAIFPKDQAELCLATAWRLVGDGQTVLVFCPLRKSVEPFADRIVDLHQRGALGSLLNVDEEVLQTAIALGREWLGENDNLLACLRLGVAIHHGALPTAYRKEVEKLLRDGVLKVTISSPTLAQGLNLTATSVVFHSLYRNGEKIPTSEFKNVIGRAGRAFIDVEGLVLYPMFDDHQRKLQQWEGLIADLAARDMESGLVRLVITLILRMQAKLNVNVAELTEYVVNNAQAWQFPEVAGEAADIRLVEAGRWENFIAWLDTAILSLFGDVDVADDQIEATLDNVLQSSLWQRRLLHRQDNMQALVRATLMSRAKYVWQNSTAAKRKGYFLAGLGLKSGSALDDLAAAVNMELVRANGSILAGEEDAAIEAIANIAEQVFAISPFIPNKLPANWRAVLASWLKGEALAQLAAAHEAEVLQFVEDGLVYRLPWAMEAIRVRGLANGDQIDEVSLEDFELKAAVAAVETGTLNQAASVLMRAGFNSRLAAIKAVTDTEGAFSNSQELRAWLRSEVVAEYENDPNWPSAETRKMWDEFRVSVQPEQTEAWKARAYTASVTWTEGAQPPPAEMGVRIFEPDGSDDRLVMSASGEVLGRMNAMIRRDRKGLLRAHVEQDRNRVFLDYLGPDDFID